MQAPAPTHGDHAYNVPVPFLTRGGVNLHYEASGNPAGAPMLFVHGWCCNHTYFAPQVEHFGATHSTLAVDLRGHGKSDAPEQPYTIAAFADDLAWTCDSLGIERAIVVCHSMGGLIALLLAASRPDLVRAAVFVDAPLLLPPDALAARRPILETFWGDDYVDAVIAYADDRFFIDADDPERRARILEGFAAMPQHVLASAWQSILETDSIAPARAFAQHGIPGLYIGAARPLTDMQRLREICPSIVTAQTAAAGHFCQLEVPDQVNAMLERFIRVVL